MYDRFSSQTSNSLLLWRSRGFPAMSVAILSQPGYGHSTGATQCYLKGFFSSNSRCGVTRIETQWRP